MIAFRIVFTILSALASGDTAYNVVQSSLDIPDKGMILSALFIMWIGAVAHVLVSENWNQVTGRERRR